MPHELLFFISLVDGMLAGAVYAPIALAFVVVYKASRMINFALGEWVMVASRLVATALSTLGLGMFSALGFACAGMAALGEDADADASGYGTGNAVEAADDDDREHLEPDERHLESLAAGYVDPLLGGGFSNVASYFVLISMLFVRPYGMFGRPAVERV